MADEDARDADDGEWTDDELGRLDADLAELDEGLDDTEVEAAQAAVLAAEPDDVEPIPPVSDPVGTARRRHGTAGAVLAAGLFGVDIALGRKPKEEAPVVVDAAADPTDIDKDGIRIPLDDGTHVWAPPPPPKDT